MYIRLMLALLVFWFAGCATPQLPQTQDYAFYTDALVNELWFVLQDHPDQLELVKANRGERLSAPCWKEYNKTLELFALTPELRQALQWKSIDTVLKKL
jgi:hypothetical protein